MTPGPARANVRGDVCSRVTVASMAGAADAQIFKALNEQWITELFTLEPPDRPLLDDPVNEIVAKGGAALIARADAEVVGCVALVPLGDRVLELSKMTVVPALRGLGVGRIIVTAAIEPARAAGARSLFLASSTRLPGAVHLYESVGFTHVPADSLEPYPYRRADVFMDYRLEE